MTLPIVLDLAHNGIRNKTITPGIFGRPMLFGMPQAVQDAQNAQDANVPFPSRLCTPVDYAKLAHPIIRRRRRTCTRALRSQHLDRLQPFHAPVERGHLLAAGQCRLGTQQPIREVGRPTFVEFDRRFHGLG